MNILELKEVVDQAVKDGYGETIVYFDTDGQTYDVHLVPIKGLELIPSGIVDEDNYAIFHQYHGIGIKKDVYSKE